MDIQHGGPDLFDEISVGEYGGHGNVLNKIRLSEGEQSEKTSCLESDEHAC